LLLPNLSQQLRSSIIYTNCLNGDSQQSKAFQLAKKALQVDSLLAHYDPAKWLLVACDASPLGLDTVLSHIMPDGQEKPIAYALRTLTAAERCYSELEKKA